MASSEIGHSSTAGVFERAAIAAFEVLKRLGLARLAFSAPARWIGARLLVKAVREPQTRTIAAGLGKGLQLRVLPSSPKSYWMGIHESEFQAAVERTVKPGMTVYDCGANIGYFSVVFARLVGPTGRVFAFEPGEENVASLRAAASLNVLPHLAVVPCAVWKETTTLRFATASHGGSVSDHIVGIFGGEAESSETEVKAVSLDDFVFRDGNPIPDVIKLDVEGAEADAVAGARRVLEQRRPTLLLEIHGDPGRGVWTALKARGYDFVDIATGRTPASVDEFAVWIRQYVATPR